MPQTTPALAHLKVLDLSRVLAEAGFEEIKAKYTNHGGLPKFTRWTWQSISGGLLGGRRFSDNVIAVGRKPTHGE